MNLVVLALLMAVVTYPSRALPLLAPGVERLPAPVLEYLRLVGPATLAALAAAGALLIGDGDSTGVRVGVEAVGVLACVAVAAWRRNLLVAIATAVVIVAGGRALQL